MAASNDLIEVKILISNCFNSLELSAIYVWSALSDNWYWKQIIGFFLSGRLKQVLL